MSYVYEELSTTEIARRLKADTNAGWSYEGALALAEWVQEYAEQSETPQELDIVALRCDFSEYASLEEYNKDCGFDYADLDALRDDTTVIDVEGGRIIVQAH